MKPHITTITAKIPQNIFKMYLLSPKLRKPTNTELETQSRVAGAVSGGE